MLIECTPIRVKSEVVLKQSNAAITFLASNHTEEVKAKFQNSIFEATSIFDNSACGEVDFRISKLPTSIPSNDSVIKISEYDQLMSCAESYILLDNILFSSAEAAYYYMLFPDDLEFLAKILSFRKLNLLAPDVGEKKVKACHLLLPTEKKLTLMYSMQWYKFVQDEALRLLANHLKGKYITYDNKIHDNFWGKCKCSRCSQLEQYDYLGKILTRLFQEIN